MSRHLEPDHGATYENGRTRMEYDDAAAGPDEDDEATPLPPHACIYCGEPARCDRSEGATDTCAECGSLRASVRGELAHVGGPVTHESALRCTAAADRIMRLFFKTTAVRR